MCEIGRVLIVDVGVEQRDADEREGEEQQAEEETTRRLRAVRGDHVMPAIMRLQMTEMRRGRR